MNYHIFRKWVNKMIELDIKEIKKEVIILDDLLKKYEEINLNLFNELKDVCINWQDGDSKIFETKIYDEKIETSTLINTLKDTINIFRNIVSSYQEIGQTIKCNLNQKNNIINTINTCLNQANDIIRQYNYINASFDSTEQIRLNNQKNKMYLLRDKLLTIKEDLIRTCKKIETIETNIQKSFQNLEPLTITDFNKE